MRIFILLIIASLLFGCASSLDRLGYIPKNNLEKEIAALKITNAKDLQLKQTELKKSLEDVIAAKTNQLQNAANGLYGFYLVKPYIKHESRPLLIAYNRVDEIRAAVGLGPTVEAMVQEQARLIEELDESKTSLEQLTTTHQAKVAENAALVAATKQHELIVKKLEQEKIDIERTGLEKLIGKQDELNTANNIIIEKEKQNAESKKYIEANKTRISIASGLLAVACIVGAFFSPLFKDKLALLGGVFGVISVGIIFLQPWHVAVFTVICLIGIGAFFLRKTSIMDRLNSNLVNTFQTIKENSTDLYEKEVKPHLIEWNTQYAKNGKKVEDTAVTNHIEEILKDFERK